MTDIADNRGPAPSLDGLAAKADEVITEAGDKADPETHRRLLNELDHVHHELLAALAHHYNRARQRLDEALYRHNSSG